MTRLEQIRARWRSAKEISPADIDFVLRFTETPPSLDDAREAVRHDLHMAVCCGPLMNIESRLDAAIERTVSKIVAGMRAELVQATEKKTDDKITSFFKGEEVNNVD